MSNNEVQDALAIRRALDSAELIDFGKGGRRIWRGQDENGETIWRAQKDKITSTGLVVSVVEFPDLMGAMLWVTK